MADLPATANRRAVSYRQRAAELARSANREQDADRRRHMLDLAKDYWRAADEIAPLPPAEPEIFR